MKKEELRKSLVHSFPALKNQINARIDSLPEEVKEAHKIMNEFRKMDPSLTLQPGTLNRVHR
jgi:hypothetical protein